MGEAYKLESGAGIISRNIENLVSNRRRMSRSGKVVDVKRPIAFITTMVLVILICCIAAGLFWDGYFLPGKPCRLLTYPNATRTAKPFSLVVPDPINTVLEYYDEHLDPHLAPLADFNEWEVEKLSDASYLYSCYGSDLNLITGETGCIFVSVDGAYTKIVGEFYRSEGSNTPCERE